VLAREERNDVYWKKRLDFMNVFRVQGRKMLTLDASRLLLEGGNPKKFTKITHKLCDKVALGKKNHQNPKICENSAISCDIM